MKHEEGLLLVGYRVVPPWAVPASMYDPLLPAQVATMSDHLVDPVPDDDTWFASAKAAVAAVPPAVEATTWVMAMGLQERDADEAIARRLTLDTDQLCLNEQLRTPWPTELNLLGYEVIGIEACGFHSWLCYDGAASWAHRWGSDSTPTGWSTNWPMRNASVRPRRSRAAGYLRSHGWSPPSPSSTSNRDTHARSRPHHVSRPSIKHVLGRKRAVSSVRWDSTDARGQARPTRVVCRRYRSLQTKPSSPLDRSRGSAMTMATWGPAR